MNHTEQGPAWDHQEGAPAPQPPTSHQQQQDSMECMMDADGDGQGGGADGQQQQQQQQALLIQQQVMQAANQLYPGARLGDWQPHQQQWASLGWPQQEHQQQQGQQRQQQPSAGSWGSQPQHRQQQQQPPAHWSPQPHPLPPQQQQGREQQRYLGHKQQLGSPMRSVHQQGWQPHQQRQGEEDEVLMGAAGPAAARVLHCRRVTQSENGITNGIEIFDSCEFNEGDMGFQPTAWGCWLLCALRDTSSAVSLAVFACSLYVNACTASPEGPAEHMHLSSTGQKSVACPEPAGCGLLMHLACRNYCVCCR